MSLNLGRPAGGPVALPELVAVGRGRGREVERPVHVHQIGGLELPARVDVVDQDGAGGRAVALPELGAVGAVVGGEEERRLPTTVR